MFIGFMYNNLEHSEPEEKLVNNRRKTRLMENNKTNLTGDPFDLNNENKYDMSCLLIRITVCHWNGHISSTTCHTEVQDAFYRVFFLFMKISKRSMFNSLLRKI